jgi:hypothetical protein
VFFYYVAIAFTVWMIVDAIRRRAEFYWFLIIIFFAPIGSVIYFAVVKVKDYDLSKLGKLGRMSGRLSVPAQGDPIASLERAHEETPSVANKLALADALEVAQRYDQAMPRYREVLGRDRDDKQALHGLARCLLGTGKPAEAAEQLERVMELDSAYRDYSAALEYAEALWQADRRDDAIDLLTGLASVSTRINHRVALAHYLLEDKRVDRAREVLTHALTEYESSPAFVKRRDSDWARRAQTMLAGLD